MGRSPCCDKVGLKKGPWTPEEDQKLLAYIEEHGHGSWRALPSKAGLQRCGKSCRLRWTNYLRPDIKRGKFSLQEEQTIIQLHALLGNRWSSIATHLPKRTDNEIKNYWNTHLKKRLTKMGIDPVTHKPKNDALLSSVDGNSNKTAANLSHMAQWESARLEAEARLVRESKLQSHSLQISASPTFPLSTSSSSSSSSSSAPIHSNSPLDHAMKAWNGNGGWLKPNNELGNGGSLESPTSTLSFSGTNAPPILSTTSCGSTILGKNKNNKNYNSSNNNNNSTELVVSTIEIVGTTNSRSSDEDGRGVEDDNQDWNKGYEYKDGGDDDDGIILENPMGNFNSSMNDDDDGDELAMINMENATWGSGDDDDVADNDIAEEGFTNLLLNDDANNESNNELSLLSSQGGEFCWNSFLHLVNSDSPSDDSPMF